MSSSGVGGETRKAHLIALITFSIFFAMASSTATFAAVQLVELNLNAAKRQFTPDYPVNSVSQEFGIQGPGVLTIEYVTDPRTPATNGGLEIKAKDGSSFYLGREVSYQETPKPCLETSRCVRKQVIMVSEPSKRLEASLTAWWVPQALQVWNYGDQFGAKQQLSITFVPFDQAVGQGGGAPPAVDISGTWREGDVGQTWTFTPKGNGLYDAVENGFGNARGTARVSGNTITVEFTNTTPYRGQTKGVWTAEVDPTGTTAEAGYLMDNGESGSFTWTRQTPLPVPPTPPTQPTQPVQPTPPEPVPLTPAQLAAWEATAETVAGDIGKQFTFDCPAGGTPADHLWGTDIYTTDSRICVAAVHAGIITFAGGGTVTIEIHPDVGTYTGSARNGVTSQSWGPYSGGSYTFAGGTAGKAAPAQPPPPAEPVKPVQPPPPPAQPVQPAQPPPLPPPAQPVQPTPPPQPEQPAQPPTLPAPSAPKATAETAIYRIVDYAPGGRREHVYQLDVANCTLDEPASIGSDAEITDTTFATCQKNSRLTFAVTRKDNSVTLYDWVLTNSGGVVNGAYVDSAGTWGPSFGTRVR